MTATAVPQPEDNRGLWAALLVFLVILAVQITTQHMMDRLWICACGYVKLWEGGVNTSGNSQHISDWYTPSHIIHGFLFYALGSLLFHKRPVALRLGFATLIETAWEILENTPLIIDRYRAETIALNYYGDSILNSAMDTVFMALGFLLAWRLPIWVTVALAIGAEVYTGYMIRDNLTLNVIMLVWPVDAIKAWQGAV